MSENIKQVYDTNPAVAMLDTDIMYLGRSPYGTSDDYAINWSVFQDSIYKVGTILSGTWHATTIGIAYGGTGVTSVTTAPTVSAWAGWDANKNLSADNFLAGFTTTATAATATVLTVDSTYLQFFTGSTTQTVQLPVTSTLALGQAFYIVNNSSGLVTITSSGGNTVQILAANTAAIVTCIAITGTTDASWNATYLSDAGGVISAQGTANQVLVNGTSGSAQVGALTFTLPQSIGTGSSPTFSGLTLTTGSVSTLPVNGNDIVNKTYADSIASGITVQGACYAGTTANLGGYIYVNGASGVGATLTAGSNGAFTTDGVSPALNARILVKNQSTSYQNGIYTLTTIGTVGTLAILTRAADYDQASEINPGDLVVITAGTTLTSSSWLQTATVTTIGTDPISFSQFTASLPITVPNGGTGITSIAANQLLYGSGVNTIAALSTGTGVITALGQNVSGSGSMALTTSPSFTTPALGTPSAGVLSNCTAYGALRSFQVFTSGTAATYTLPAGIKSILIETLGGGGGGGGALGTGATGIGCAAGGGSGGYASLFVLAPSGTYTYTVGAAGAAGTSGNNAGGAGGTTTFSASSLQATGGSGGTGGPSTSTSSGGAVKGGDAGVGTNGNINSGGAPGGAGINLFGVAVSGLGGSSIYGGGASAVSTVTTGLAAGSYGSGGSGAIALNNSQAGGAGSAGLIRVWEFG